MATKAEIKDKVDALANALNSEPNMTAEVLDEVDAVVLSVTGPDAGIHISYWETDPDHDWDEPCGYYWYWNATTQSWTKIWEPESLPPVPPDTQELDSNTRVLGWTTFD